MQDRPVFLVAFQEQDNLGVGYLASSLLENGYSVKVVDFRIGKEAILDSILRHCPLVVGFSVIFQYHIYDFRDLLSFLREKGVRTHFCAGGHYPSLRPKELFNVIEDLDSIVLFEGEHTFLALVKRLSEGRNWSDIEGIAHKKDGTVVFNRLRPLEVDVDRFPPPLRRPLKEYALGRKYATLLAGRGCLYNCSFCSIREFYSRPPGPVKRVRRPEMVVREMELLFEQMDCSIFMFQDDDFPVARNGGREWVWTFCRLLREKGLSSKILWKINCRPDEVDGETFALMKDHGLFLVYLGIESGTDEGLRLMNKRIKADVNERAVRTLKELLIDFDYGFMLFDPSSTLDSVRANLDFLERICGDGSSPISFCKMLPYAGTKIERELSRTGRMKGAPGFEDYDFLDARLDIFYAAMTECFGDWITHHDGLVNLARWARYYSAIWGNFFDGDQNGAYRSEIRKTISESNTFFLETGRMLCSAAEYESDLLGSIFGVRENVDAHHKRYLEALNHVINEIQSRISGCS